MLSATLLLLLAAVAPIAAQTTLRVFGRTAMMDSTTGETLFLKQLLTKFETENRCNVTVELVNYSDEDYRSELIRRLDTAGSDGGADIYMVEQSWVVSLLDSYFVDLQTQDVAALDRQLNGQVRETLELDTVNGKVAAVPFWADYGLFYYRTDVLQELQAPVPRSWREIDTICRRYINRTSFPSTQSCFMTGFKNQSGIYAVSEWLFSTSGSPLIQSGQKFNFGDPNFAEMLQQMKNWTQSTPPIIRQQTLSYAYDDAFREWSAGNAVFFQGRASHYHRSVLATSIAGRWNVTTLPGRTANQASTTVGGYHLAIGKASPNKALAFKLLMFLNSEEVQADRVTRFGVPSSWKSYLSTTNATVCSTQVPCAALANVTAYNVLPAKNVGPLWLRIADSMGRDLVAFFQNANLSVTEALSRADRNVQTIIDAAIAAAAAASSSAAAAAASATSTASTTSSTVVSVSSATDGPSTANTPIVTIISGVVASIVAIAIIVALLIIQKRSNNWPFRSASHSNPKPTDSNPYDLPLGASAGDPDGVSYGVPPAAAGITHPAAAATLTGGKYTWEANPSPRHGTILHSQTSKSYPFASDYDSVPPSTPLHRPAGGGVRTSEIDQFRSPGYPAAGGARATPPVPGSVLGAESLGGFASLQRHDRGSVSVVGGAAAVSALTMMESVGRKLTVLYPYEPSQMDELALEVGEQVMLKMAYDDGYAFGEVETPDGGVRAGVFPLACLIPSTRPSNASTSPSSNLLPTPPMAQGPPGGSPYFPAPTSASNSNGSPQPPHRGVSASTSSVANPLSASSPPPTSPTATGGTGGSGGGLAGGSGADSPEALFMSGKLTEDAYLRIRRERKEREERQVAALKERLARPDLAAVDRERLQKRLDELELGLTSA
ncbi:hypothetical protein HDU96_006308 [Phlyctochytrium bullatum]|nr:hypothetical protein HDU96_006308 [Phlyctochytrium bullatum]